MSKAFLCKTCNKVVTVREFIDSCEQSWMPQQWFSYHCPKCKKFYTLEIKSDLVRFGFIDGAPGPCFIPEYSQRIPGLEFHIKKESIKLTFENYSKDIELKK